MRMFPFVCLVACLVSVQALFSGTDAPAWQTRSFRLLDAGSGTPIAGAKVLVFPSIDPDAQWKHHASIALQRDPLEGRFIQRLPTDVGPDPQSPPLPVSDASGRVALSVPLQDATMLVMNEKGIAYLREGQWDQKGGDVHASLQAWASLSGTVTLRGKPAAGVVIEFSRFSASASIGSMVDFYFPPVQHSVAARTDQEGRFKIERLLPTALDGSHNVPYNVQEIMGANPDLQVEDVPEGRSVSLGIGMPTTTMALGRGEITLAAGDHQDFDLAATPRCEREVSGRLVWADGTPLGPSDLKRNSIDLMPQGFNGMSGFFPPLDVDADGRFKTTVLIAGKWLMQSFHLHPVGAAPFGIPFILPDASNESGKGDPVDLGDIVFQKAGHVDATPPKPDDQGQVEIAFALLDDHRHPLSEATVKVHALVAAEGNGSRYLYPKNILDVRTDASGVVRMKVPGVFRDEDGKDWSITGAALEMSHEGYEPWKRTFTLGERGAVIALKTAASVSVRVAKEGQPRPPAQVRMRVGWVPVWDSFEYRNWQGSGEDGVLLRDRVPTGKWQVQAGHLDSEKWRWFSEVTEIPAPGQKTPAVLTLRRGTRVTGTLDASVPRPVTRGIVRVVVRMPPPSDASASPILWSDWQRVDENGNFVFRGLPPGDAWIAASCEGWISQAPKAKSKRLPGDPNWSDPISMLWRAIPFHVDAADTSVVVPMIRAGTIVFRFRHPDGTAVTDAHPRFNANLDLGPAREPLAGTERALDQFLAGSDENGYRPGEFLPRLPEELDATGTLRLENLPPTRLRLSLHSGGHQFSPADVTLIPSDHPHDRYAPFQADVKSGEVIEKEFVVVSKE